MGLWTAKEIWRGLPRDQRTKAALSLWECERVTRTDRIQALVPWLQARGLRPAFFEQLPRARKAAMMGEGGLPEETAMQVLLAYHLQHHRPMLKRFLDELGIENDDGLVKEGVELSEQPAEKVDAAVKAIREAFEEGDVETYLRTLTASDPEAWAGVSAHTGDAG